MVRPLPARRFAKPCGGFTLVEILIVVVILGILAAMVVPQFTNAGEASQENSLAMNLHRIRSQIELYTQEHMGQEPSDDPATFVAQMTQATDRAGNTAAPGTPGFPLGPYLRDIPVNPFTGARTVGSGAVGTSDWYYENGMFRANDTQAHRDL